MPFPIDPSVPKGYMQQIANSISPHILTRSRGHQNGATSITLRATPSLNEPRIRIIVIFSSVIFLSLTAAWIGCVIASRHGKRRKLRPKKNNDAEETITNGSLEDTPVNSSAETSSDHDMEWFGQLDTIMASDTFIGREWNVYKKEMRKKAQRQARGIVRTSQGINSPINVRQLKGKMKKLSRSLIGSMARSDTAQESFPEPGALNEILTRLQENAKISNKTADSNH